MVIGIIAEDISDVDVLYELTCKLTEENSFSFKKSIGHGCGKIRRKCAPWAKNLLNRGCTHLVILHDLDEKDESKLRSELTDYVKQVGFESYLILIPVREIEAWLLTDNRALKNVFTMTNLPKLPKNPELITNPKKKLRDIVWRETKKHYINTIHNKKIATASQISKLKRCTSFCPYPKFITSLYKTS